MIQNLKMLVELAEVDKKIAKLTPLKIKIKIRLNDKIAERDSVQKKLTNIQNNLDDTQSKINFYENDILEINNRLQKNIKLEDKLTTKKEFTAISIENSIAKEKINTANYEIDKFEKIQTQKKQEKDELCEIIIEINKNINSINIHVSQVLYQINIDNKKFEEERKKFLNNIHSKIIQFYQSIYIWAKDTAVVEVIDQACRGCFIRLNDSVYSELILNKELITCSNCGRILYI